MKSNKTKSAMTALVVAAMLCSAAMPIRAAEAQWVNNNGTWSYVKEDGSIAKGWIKDNDCWYAFDDNGAMRTGWIASNEHWYFMGESGVMQADAWVEDNGARYYIKGTGVMAKDYVKDGYELTEDGKAIPLAESKSVVLTDPEAIEGEVIEGNLYVDVTTAKALELKGVTVKGKLVVIGDNKTAGKLTITDSKIESISTQTRNTEVVLSGETEVKTIVLEETAAVTPDKSFKGEVEKIEVQSTTKDEIVIEVPAQEVTTRTYASVDIQAPVESLEVKTDTQIKVNADVKNVVVTESAKDTAIEVSKGSTVGTLTADAPVSIDGKGTVNKVEANVDGVEAGKDTVIKDVETGKDVTEAPKENKPSTGGSTGGGSSSGGSTTKPTLPEVKTYEWEAWDGSTIEKQEDGNYLFAKGNWSDSNNGYTGPMTKDLHSTIVDGGTINEAVTVKVDPSQYGVGESFGVSVGINDKDGNYYTELCVDFIWSKEGTLTASIGFEHEGTIEISQSGFYTLRWIIDGSGENLTGTFVVTTEDGTEIGKFNNIKFTINNSEVKTADCTTARYMWFYRVPETGLIVKNVAIKETVIPSQPDESEKEESSGADQDVDNNNPENGTNNDSSENESTEQDVDNTGNDSVIDSNENELE
ncbi:N-acetylmuramoyl-L-alanine amidase family protein [Dielma fastidiosa]|uniref:N-acetylmuramoyl-L-alanine amidase family protein n=1 Tax=Dielma fastidiosa TaxID=1034346 RepID=UPI0015F9E594|nr:hypothetical protein [Dielma fastidiosa]